MKYRCIKYSAMLMVILMASTVAEAQMNIRVRGKGVDIDNVGSSGYKLMYPIGTRTGWEANYYIPGQYHLFDVRPVAIVNKDFATTGKSPGDSRTDYSIDSFSADAPGMVTIAVPSGSLNAPGWVNTTTNFSSSISIFLPLYLSLHHSGHLGHDSQREFIHSHDSFCR